MKRLMSYLCAFQVHIPGLMKLARATFSSTYCYLTYWILKLLKMLTPNEITQCLNLARALDLITSSRTVGGVLYVYNSAGYAKPWDSFISEYPLERLQAMIKNRS